MIGLHMVYLLKEGVLDESGCNTCELLTTRKERNDYLFNFYLGRVSLNAFMEFLRSPDSNVDAILLNYIEAEIAALHVQVKRRRKIAPKRLPSPKKEEAAAEGELRDLLKKPRNSAPVARTSFVPMTLPVSLPPTTEPINPTTDVCRAAPTILRKRRPDVTSTVTTYKLPIPLATAAPPQPPRLLPPPPPYGLPPVLRLRHSPTLRFRLRHRMLSTAASGYQPLYTPINHQGQPFMWTEARPPCQSSAATLSPSRGWWLCTN